LTAGAPACELLARLPTPAAAPAPTSRRPPPPPPARQVNPAGTVPSLADASGKVVSTSSRGIVELVDGLGGGPLGGKGADRKLVASWIDNFDK
jgi:glutathione S-transferase